MSSILNFTIQELRVYVSRVLENGKNAGKQGVDDADKVFFKQFGINSSDNRVDSQLIADFVDMMSNVGLNMSEERQGFYSKLEELFNELLKAKEINENDIKFLLQGLVAQMQGKSSLEDLIKLLQQSVTELKINKGIIDKDSPEAI